MCSEMCTSNPKLLLILYNSYGLLFKIRYSSSRNKDFKIFHLSKPDALFLRIEYTHIECVYQFSRVDLEGAHRARAP